MLLKTLRTGIHFDSDHLNVIGLHWADAHYQKTRHSLSSDRRDKGQQNIMKVCEIFTSIQGESTYAGVPCTFIRMSGCNLRCTYCDTTYAYDEGRELSEEEILDEVRKAGFRTIEITGGEPLLQGGIFPLMKRLLDQGYRLLIETEQGKGYHLRDRHP